jgi:prolyl oligopeptidase
MRQLPTIGFGLCVAACACTPKAGLTPAPTAACTCNTPKSTPEAAVKQPPPAPHIAYPVTRKVDVVEELHGIKVADPYRWLEDLDSKETADWVAAQNKVSFGYLETIPCREPIKQRLTKLWDYEKYGLPGKEGGRYFFSRNSGLQNQSVLYVTDKLDAAPRELLDPNTLSKDGTVALSSLAISDDGNLLAYGLSTAGSDWIEFKVRDVATAKDLPDHIKWVKFSGAAWTKDNKGFFYSRYDEPKEGNPLENVNYFQKLYYHRLGTSQPEDQLVYHRPDQKKWGFQADVTEDGHYLIIHVNSGTDPKGLVFYKDLTKPDAPIVELISEFIAKFDFVGNDGPVFWFNTDLDAPRGRLIAIDTREPARENWKELVPQSDDTLQGVSAVGGHFVANYLHDASTRVRVFDLSGKHVRDIKLPGLGSAGGFGGKLKDPETFYSFTSFNYAPTIFRYNVATNETRVFKKPKVDFDPSAYEVKQIFYHSKDGTRIPMFITYKKGLTLNGNNPTYLYGYGGFDISLTPGFSVSNLVWMEMGGVFAEANLRGGGEYGKAWHDAGRLANKQNVFDDFIAAGEWLIANHYTCSKRLAIGGGSNGGLLVGAAETQRPDLFGAALPAVGVMDMLRFDKFTIGWAWKDDYGDPAKAADFKVLYAYSPLQHIKPGTCYPPTLITTGDHDDRVVPSHSFKFAATMQADQSCDNPILIRIETRAGHGAGKPTTKIIEEQTDRWAFLTRVFGMDCRLP